MVEDTGAEKMKPVKQPEDHKLPKDAPREIDVMGVKLTIDPKKLDDLDVVECIYDIDNAKNDTDGTFKIVPLLRKLLGDDYGHVKKELREKNGGILNMETTGEFMTKLFEEMQGKN